MIKRNDKKFITLVEHSQYNRIQSEINDNKTLIKNGIKQVKITSKKFNVQYYYQ